MALPTQSNMDKVAILSLEKGENWAHFLKQLVGKKAFKKKQASRKKTSAEPPTYNLKHGSRNLEISHLIATLLNPRLVRLTMAFCKLVIIVYDHSSESALVEVNKLLSLALTIKDAKQVVVVALANSDCRKKSTSKSTAGVHDRKISNSLQFHNISSHIFLDLRCKRLKELMMNFRCLLANKLQSSPGNSPKQVRLKRERPGPSVCSNISSTNVQTLRKKCRSESPTPSNGSSDNNHFMLQRPPHSENSNNEPETCGFNIFKKYSTSSLASQAANTNTMCKTKNVFGEILAKVNGAKEKKQELNFTHIRVKTRLSSKESVDTVAEPENLEMSEFPIFNKWGTNEKSQPNVKSIDSKMSKFMEACSTAQFRMRMLLPSSQPEKE